MGRQSSIKKLPDEIQEVVNESIRSGHTIAQIVDAVRGLGAQVSDSAVWRYASKARVKMERFREAQELAKVWSTQFEDNPQGDVGLLLGQMLRTVAFQQIGEMGGDEADPEAAGPGANEIALLAKAIKDMAQADRHSQARFITAKKEVEAEQLRKLATLEKNAKAGKATGGLTPEVLATIRHEIYGIPREES